MTVVLFKIYTVIILYNTTVVLNQTTPVSVKSEPREDGREQRDRKPRGIDSGQITPWAPSPWCGSKRPDITPPAKPAFDGARAENQKPPQGKSYARRGFAAISENFNIERGEGFLLCVVVYDNV